MKRLTVYIHGKGGRAEDAERYRALFPGREVIGFDYHASAPWEAAEEFGGYFDRVSAGFDRVDIVAESIGAYFALVSLGEKKIDRAFFISPVVDMERLILDMLSWAGATEEELKRRGKIETDFGETLSYPYLLWVREHPPVWRVPTEILAAGGDTLQSVGTQRRFAESVGAGLTVMENGEHWFHTEEQLKFLDAWLLEKSR